MRHVKLILLTLPLNFTILQPQQHAEKFMARFLLYTMINRTETQFTL